MPRGGAGRSTQFFGQMEENSWPSIKRASPENGLLPRWWVTGWKVWTMPAWANGTEVDPGLQSE